jgi:hypothetical protein
MCTMIHRASLSVLVLCLCTACASGGGTGQLSTGYEPNPRFVQVPSERNGDFAFYLVGDSVGDPSSRGMYRIPPAETGILPSYEVGWTPRR